MSFKTKPYYLLSGFIMIMLLAQACGLEKTDARYSLKEVASSENQWTGLTKDASGRLFVNFPRWSNDVPVSVAEIRDGEILPYPNEQWNDYLSGTSAEDKFICVQSVVVDDANDLWVLDPANPAFKGVVSRGPRLYQFDLGADTLKRAYSFTDSIIQENSYLNDVRIDVDGQKAYMTDSGVGAIIILDLQSGSSYRHLEDHYSVKAEESSLMINGKKWEGEIHSDGIALSPDGDDLYYAPLSGHTLYNVPTEQLNNPDITEFKLESYVEKAEDIRATDGILFDEKGVLYLGGLEENAIYAWKENSTYERLIQDERIKWADTFTSDAEGRIYFTTSQIHLSSDERGAYKIYQLVD